MAHVLHTLLLIHPPPHSPNSQSAIQADPNVSIDPLLFLLNALVAFGLNMAVFLLIGKTSALTMNIGGVVKDWLLIGLSYWIYAYVEIFLCFLY